MDALVSKQENVHEQTLATRLGESAAAPAEAPQRLRVAGHELTVFAESGPLLASVLADILAAKRRVWIEVYIFYHDETGKKIAEALKQKAREGLDVRLHHDAVGCSATPPAFFNDLAAAGVKVHEFHPLLEGLRRFRLLTFANRRNHRKVFVMDDFAAYFGGMNIIENVESVEQEKAEKKPKSSGWRDVHIRISGPQQGALAESFERSWRRAHGERVARRSRAYRRAMYLRHSKSSESIHFFDSGPGRKNTPAARVFHFVLRSARRSITISMAYFLPIGKSLRALLRARRRGVRVRVIVPGKSDVKLVQRATAYVYDKLLRRGFRVYERRDRMLHSKVVVVDESLTLVGSANLDPRSLYHNLEILAVIRSREFAAIVGRICRYEISQSDRITLAATRRVPWYQRMINQVAYSLRWWL